MNDYNEKRKARLRASLNLSDESLSDVEYTVKKSKNEWVGYAVIGVMAIVMIVFHSLFAIAKVDGRSMDPTLKNNQFMMVSKTESVDRFDIVVLDERTENNGPTKKIVKRVIGMPGDTVTVLNGELFINDEKFDEDYLDDANIIEWNKTSFTIRVPSDHYFVLGDNRDISKDSRHVGNFVSRAVIGVKI